MLKQIHFAIAAFALMALTLSGCGGGGVPEPETENLANFSADGFSVRATQTSVNTYQFTIIENTKYPNAVFSVYGLEDDSQLGTFNTNSKMRLAHVVDASQPEQTFEVTFNDNDVWFAIYRDDWDGFGWIYSTRTPMLSGQFRQ